MFFEWSTCAVGVFVEEEKSLRELAVVESVLAEKTAHNVLVLLGLNKCIDALAVCLDACFVEKLAECEFMDFGEEGLYEICIRLVRCAVSKFEQVLEHSAGGS